MKFANDQSARADGGIWGPIIKKIGRFQIDGRGPSQRGQPKKFLEFFRTVDVVAICFYIILMLVYHERTPIPMNAPRPDRQDCHFSAH